MRLLLILGSGLFALILPIPFTFWIWLILGVPFIFLITMPLTIKNVSMMAVLSCLFYFGAPTFKEFAEKGRAADKLEQERKEIK